MPGLAFLAKKSWHTSNLNNQEKVWLAEQATVAEEAKTRELTRQLQQERETDEVHRLAGRPIQRIDRLDRGIDWMYQSGGPAGVEQRKKEEAEEYLLGKEYNPAQVKTGDFAATTGLDHVIQSVHHKTELPLTDASASLRIVDRGAMNSSSNNITNKSSFSTHEDNKLDWNESFSRRYEDPMYMVEQKKVEREAEMKKRQLLLQRVAAEQKDNRGDLTKTAKSQRDESSSSSLSSSSSSSDRRHKKKSSSNSSKRHKRKHSKRENDRHYYSDEDRHHRKKHKERKHSSRLDEKTHHRSRSSAYSERVEESSQYHRARTHDDDRDKDPQRIHSSAKYENSQATRPAQQKEDQQRKMDGYGLQQQKHGSHNNHAFSNDTLTLGPDERFIQRKRMETQESKRSMGKSSRSTNGQYTSYQEKEAARQQMQHDAMRRREDLSQRTVTSQSMVQHRQEEYNPELVQRGTTTNHGHPARKDHFINDITSQVAQEKMQRKY